MTIKNGLLLMLVALVASGCGYAFEGAAGTGTMPGDVKSVHVSVLENRTFETGVENRFTNDLAYEFTRSPSVSLAGKAEADAVLSGVIRSMTVDTIAHTTVGLSAERRVTVIVDLALRGRDGQILWAANGLSEREEYEVNTGDKYQTEQLRRVAIDKLSRRFAEKVYLGLSSNF